MISDPAQRAKLFSQAASLEHRDRPIVYLYHRQWLWAHTNRLSGYRVIPDGLVRLQDMRIK